MIELTLAFGETFTIGEIVKITPFRGKGYVVKMGIDAPRSINIARSEIYKSKEVREAIARYAKDN